jgi:signal transduction histidine kinase/ActR/RegA family two-component response regulator
MAESGEPATRPATLRSASDAPDAAISQNAQLQALGDLVVALTESRSIGRILSLVGQKLKTLFDSEVVQVWMMGEAGKELHLALTLVDDEHRLAAVLADYKIEDLATSSFTSAEAVRSRRLVVRRATDAVPRRVAEIMAAGELEMTMSFPILARDEIHGAINVMFRRAIELTSEDLRFLDTIGRMVAVAIETARLVDGLTRERRWLRLILDEIPSGVLISEGEDGRLTHANKAFQRIAGPIEGLSVRDLPARFRATDAATGLPMHWQDLALGRALVSGEPAQAEYDVTGDDGVRRTVFAYAAPLGDPLRHEPAAIVAMHDVTELKWLERENRRQARLLQFTFDNVPAGIAILDAKEARYVELNERYARCFQNPRITREAILGRKVSDLYPEFESSGLADIFRRVRDSREPFSAEAFEFQGFARGPTYWNVSLVPLVEDDGVRNLLLFVLEVTSLVEADRRLRATLAEAETTSQRLEDVNRELREVMRVKDEFLSTLSHELRTPLTPVLGWTRILKSHGADEALLDQGLKAIERNVMVQVRLVDDLLDLSRLAYDKIRLSLERVEIVTILRDAWEEVRPDAEAKEIRLEMDFPDEPVMIEGDRLRLRQIFTNLLTNAVKFSEEGGRVQLVARPHGEKVEIEVADEGIGIEADFLPRVFERFQQADPSTTRRHGGLGIGLSIAKSLTEMHGGAIAVESAGRGQGSRIRLDFPRREVHELPAEEEMPAAGPGLAGIRILLADDEVDTLEALRYVLELEGGSVITAESGRDAIELALECVPQVLLCDLQMLDVEGYEVARRIRAMPETGGIRLIALSGHGGDLDLERAQKAGFDEHVLKPVEAETLVSAIRRVLERDTAGQTR